MIWLIAACVGVSAMSSRELVLEADDRLVGEFEGVVFAAVQEAHDDAEQARVGGEIIGDRAAAAQMVRGYGVGVSRHLAIADAHSAFNQHIAQSSVAARQAGSRQQVPAGPGCFLADATTKRAGS